MQRQPVRVVGARGRSRELHRRPRLGARAQAAERRKFDFLFFGDLLAQTQRSEADAPNRTLEPTNVATAIALATDRIGLVTAVAHRRTRTC